MDGRYFLASGSSQSTAVVSGFVAAMLSRYPDLTNDQVKFLFENRAEELKNVEDFVEGEGKIDPKDSIRSVKDALKPPVQDHPGALPTSGLVRQHLVRIHLVLTQHYPFLQPEHTGAAGGLP